MPLPTPSEDMGSRGVVLVVDDDVGVLRLTTRLLTTSGYRVFTAGDGLQALDLLAGLGEPVDLVVSDLRMPRMDGYLLAEQLLRRRPTPRMLFISGFGPSERIGDLPGPLLPKPFSGEALLEQVARLLDR